MKKTKLKKVHPKGCARCGCKNARQKKMGEFIKVTCIGCGYSVKISEKVIKELVAKKKEMAKNSE